MGGYKSFGTEGQGDSPVGTKDTNDTTCGDRILLLNVRATQDTSDTASSSSTTSSSHPVVMASTSHMTFEVGSYAFYDDLEIYGAGEESASILKTSWMLITVASLFFMSFTA